MDRVEYAFIGASMLVLLLTFVAGWFYATRRRDQATRWYWVLLAGAAAMLALAAIYVGFVAAASPDALSETDDLRHGLFRLSLRSAVPTVLSASAASLFAVWAVIWSSARSRADDQQARHQEWLRERTDIFVDRRDDWSESLSWLNYSAWHVVKLLVPPRSYRDRQTGAWWFPAELCDAFEKTFQPTRGGAFAFDVESYKALVNGETPALLERIPPKHERAEFYETAEHHWETWVRTTFGAAGSLPTAISAMARDLETAQSRVRGLASGQQDDLSLMLADVAAINGLLLDTSIDRSERVHRFSWTVISMFYAQNKPDLGSAKQLWTETRLMPSVIHAGLAETLIRPTLLRRSVLNAIRSDPVEALIPDGNVSAATTELLQVATASYSQAKEKYQRVDAIVDAIAELGFVAESQPVVGASE